MTILGGGIAGLAVATALARRGLQTEIIEQAPVLREVGAGLQITPNGMRVLSALELADQAAALSQAAEAVELIDGQTGALVTRIDLHQLAPAGQFRFFHRADLLALLETAARAAGVGVTLGVHVDRVDLTGPRPRYLANGQVHETGLLVGADGLHSVLRPALNGTSAPFFTRQIAWRATIPAQGDIPPIARVYMGAGRHLVTYPLRGGQLRNIVAVEERDRWTEESWSLADDALALRLAFESFIPEARGWLDRIHRVNLWGLFRHPVANHWHGAHSAILGDAAHPTLPFLAQGANMALEDAWVLAACLASGAPTIEALQRYQALRRDRCRRIVEAANANARRYHLSGVRRDVAHAGLRLLSRLAPTAAANRFRWLYGYDVTQAV